MHSGIVHYASTQGSAALGSSLIMLICDAISRINIMHDDVFSVLTRFITRVLRRGSLRWSMTDNRQRPFPPRFILPISTPIQQGYMREEERTKTLTCGHHVFSLIQEPKEKAGSVLFHHTSDKDVEKLKVCVSIDSIEG